MKILKRIYALLLAVIMTVATVGTTTAFAAEAPYKNADFVEVESANIEVCSEDYKPMSGLTVIVNQSFSMYISHQGSTRTYNYNNLGVICSFTDQNGNTPADGTILSIQLYDSNNNLVHEWQGSNGAVLVQTYPITYGGRYYFKYVVAYGTPNLNLHVLIVSAV